MFSIINSTSSGINFVNKVENTDKFNIFSYRNFYNGGGVGIGDINNDGLPDIFFSANEGANKLYLNQGKFKFKDISISSGIANSIKWSTGVVMVDINHDGFLDIYVCNAGFIKDVSQENELYINNGDLTFTESAKDYGLNDSGYTTHTAFFDYDNDGDLDAYILNNSFIPVNTLNYSNNRNLRAKDWPLKEFLKGGGDKLMRNDNGKFVDVSEQAGIYGSLIGFGLGVSIGDVNNDGWPDIYVSNDFYERDYLYINQKDGKFSEELEQRIDHISMSSMGSDIGDINNDGNDEIFSTDMLPSEDERLKNTTSFESNDVFQLKKQRGFYNQYVKNALQVNRGNGHFMELANYSGVSASDWSWGALFMDGDNDGLQDILVCNGIYKDVIDQDFIDFFADEIIQKMTLTGKKEELQKVIDKMPSTPIRNCFFKNEGNNRFKEISKVNGLELPTFSNGAAYGDLDNDGDLDLVINNVNQEALVYENNSKNNFISVELTGKQNSLNTKAIGSKVYVYAGDSIFYRELFPARGFQSSVDYKLVIGIGLISKIDSLTIIWPDKTKTIKLHPPINQNVKVLQENATENNIALPKEISKSYFNLVEKNDFDQHVENDYVDFYFERNIPEMLSKEGPAIAKADLNGDGMDDIFVGGGAGQAGAIYLATKKGYSKIASGLEKDKEFEDTAASFFDADGDGDLDLYIGSGGNFGDITTREMQDRVYINNNLKFDLNINALPDNGMNTSVVIPDDFDNDGDIDLFVGSRSYPMQYGRTPRSYLYLNDGHGKFTDYAEAMNYNLANAGMVTSAVWTDIDGKPGKELVVVGEWMSPKIFMYNGKTFEELKSDLDKFTGMFNCVVSFDADNDGDNDLFLGNIGDNFYTSKLPLKLWFGDFDANNTFDKIITYNVDGKDKPILMKREITDMLPGLKKQTLEHHVYSKKSIQDLIPKSVLQKSKVSEAAYFKTVLMVNNGQGNFSEMTLPNEVQYSCINTACTYDVNSDGFLDIILGGNKEGYLPQFGQLDACNGLVLLSEKGNSFKTCSNQINIRGVARNSTILRKNNSDILFVAMNNTYPYVYLINKQ